MNRVEVWRQPDGFWRWQWSADGAGGPLVSNSAFDSRESAVESARSAYPDVQLDEPHPQHRRRWSRTVVRAALAAVVAVVTVRRAVARPRR